MPTVYPSCLLTRVVDGDTYDFDITLVNRVLDVTVKLAKRIRLKNINCPEMNTAEGRDAKAFVEELIANVCKDLGLAEPSGFKIDVYRKDPHGRLEADVYLPNGSFMADELLSAKHGVFVTYDEDIPEILDSFGATRSGEVNQ